ncbi:MAG: anti-sigma factor antagonist [Microbacteriaceae bacterium]|jgi:anti-sigma B factor antagonist|nr:anti-sigma factor antagonist [Microbacteriaceae bacterium]
MDMNIDYPEKGLAIVRPVGRLNLTSATGMRERVRDLVAEGHIRVVIDLAAVSFLDSSGLGALVGGLKSTRQAGGDLRIAAPSEQVRMVLRLTNMDRILPPYGRAEEAFRP